MWKENKTLKLNLLKEIVKKATEVQKREKTEDNQRKKNILNYSAKENTNCEIETKKYEDKIIVQNFFIK